MLLVQQKCCEDVFALFGPKNPPLRASPQYHPVTHESLLFSNQHSQYIISIKMNNFQARQLKRKKLDILSGVEILYRTGRKAFFQMFVIIYQMSCMLQD